MRIKILIALIILALVPSCHSGEDGILDVAMAQEPPTLDVMVNSSISGKMIAVGNIYEKLLALSPDGVIVPELASSYALSPDGRRLSFAIRSGVAFHDGRLMDSRDAALSMNRWLDRYQAAGMIAGDARFVDEGGSISIESEESLALLPLMIASSPQSAIIVPAECISEGLLPADAPGTGPYALREWKYGESIELEAFAGYGPHGTDKTPRIGKIIYRFVPDGVTRRLGLESGIYDAIDMVSSEDIPALASNDGIQLLQGGDSGSIAVLFNKKDGIAADADFRRAVSLLADRNTLMAACYGSYGYNLSTSYMETDQEEWKAAGSDPFGHEDDALGAEYLAASGYSGSTVRILSSNLSGLDRIALALSSELGQAGIDTEVTVLDWASFLERRKDPSAWDLSVSAFSRVTLPQLKSYLSPSFPGWTETDLLEGLDEAGSLEEAEEAWRAIQPLLWEEVPAMILGHYSTVYAADSDIQGIITGEGIYFWDASLR